MSSTRVQCPHRAGGFAPSYFTQEWARVQEVGLLRIVTIALSFSEHPGANSSEYVVIYLLHLCSMIDTMRKSRWRDRLEERQTRNHFKSRKNPMRRHQNRKKIKNVPVIRGRPINVGRLVIGQWAEGPPGSVIGSPEKAKGRSTAGGGQGDRGTASSTPVCAPPSFLWRGC